MPTISKSLSYYHFTYSNFIIIQLGKDFGFIEQLYLGENSFLTFGIGTIYDNYYQTYTINDIEPDLPLCFFKENKIIFIFIPNLFISFVDFSISPPLTFNLPSKFSLSPLSTFSTPLISTNFLIDLTSLIIFKVQFSFLNIPNYINLFDKNLLNSFSILSSKISNNFNLPLLINLLIKDFNSYFISYFNIVNFSF